MQHQFLHSVFEWAVAHGHRTDNPAKSVKVLAPDVQAPVVTQPSLAYAEAPDAMRKVQASEHDPAVKLALVFTVLCAARVGEVSGATWHEMDLDAAVWTRPATRMKSKRKHHVPLSDQAVELLALAKALRRPGPLVFVAPDARRGGVRAVTGYDFSKVLRPFGIHRRRGEANRDARISRDVCDLGDGGPAGFRRRMGTRRSPTRGQVQPGSVMGVRRWLTVGTELMQAWADFILPES